MYFVTFNPFYSLFLKLAQGIVSLAPSDLVLLSFIGF
jgi:hypothetical protein